MSIPDLYRRYRDFDLLIDSRRLDDPERTLFFALPGQHRDGHDFIPYLYERGVRHFIVRKDWGVTSRGAISPPTPKGGDGSSDSFFYPAPDTVVDVLQRLAAHHRDQFEIPVVAVTGSNGKTIVKDWLTDLLEQRYRVCASPRSFNSQIGVPLSVWQLRPEHEIAVFEAGVSEAGEMEKLAAVIKPTHGVFTNLGTAHAAGFADDDQKLTEKLSLFRGTAWTLFPHDDQRVTDRATELGIAKKTWVHNRSVDYHFMRDQQGDNLQSEELDLLLRGLLPPMPRVFRRNAMTALAAAYHLGLPTGHLSVGARTLRPVTSRLEVRTGRYGNVIVNDTYSNDPESLAAALEFAAEQGESERITLILSDLPPVSWPGAEPYRRLAAMLAERVDLLIGVGGKIRTIKRYLPTLETRFFGTTRELIEGLPKLDLSRNTLLVKGARSFGLETVIPLLTRRRHRTVLEIDLAALIHNYRVYRDHLADDVRLAVMVKASAYGSGSVPVARALSRRGADYLIVAYTDEGVALREAGIDARIMVLSPNQDEMTRLLNHRLEPVIGDMESLRSALPRELSHAPGLHLEFDTGMGRLGFDKEELPAIVQFLKDRGRTSLTSVFTHLAASEDASQDAYTRRQLATFAEITEALNQAGISVFLRHALNTNGISRFPEAHFEMVRLGIGLYGHGDERLRQSLHTVLRLKAELTAIREIGPGGTVGYGRAGSLQTGGRVGVVSIGYADGLPRAAGNGNYPVLVEGKRAAILGNVCMDMCMVDLRNVPEARIGSEVVVFGPDHPLEDLAEVAGTIPYEILTGIGSRVHRVYLGE